MMKETTLEMFDIISFMFSQIVHFEYISVTYINTINTIRDHSGLSRINMGYHMKVNLILCQLFVKNRIDFIFY